MCESKASSSEDRVSICVNWPPDALFVRETDSPSSDAAISFDPLILLCSKLKFVAKLLAILVVLWQGML